MNRLYKNQKIKRIPSGTLITEVLFFAYILIIIFIPKTGYAQTSVLINLVSDGLGTGDGRGTIYIDGNIFTDFSEDIYIDTGTHFIAYIPYKEDQFLNWEVTGGIRLEGVVDPRLNSYAIYVTGPGSIWARYEEGPILKIEYFYPDINDVFIDTPIELEVVISAEDKLIDEAKISFFVNGKLVGTEDTENGYAAITYELTTAKEYKWYFKTEKTGYKSKTSPTWSFDYVKITLKPNDQEVFDALPIVLTVEVKYETSLIGMVSFFVDGKYLGDHALQVNGFASYTVRTLSSGPHSVIVIINTEKFGRIEPPSQEFYLIIIPTADLKYPPNDENITEQTSKITLMAEVL